MHTPPAERRPELFTHRDYRRNERSFLGGPRGCTSRRGPTPTLHAEPGEMCVFTLRVRKRSVWMVKQTEETKTSRPHKYHQLAYLRWHPSRSPGIPSSSVRTLASGSAGGEKRDIPRLRSGLSETVDVYEISGLKLQHGRPPKLTFVPSESSKPNYSLTVTPNQNASRQI